ncbi:extracellular solute-binding protein [Halospeciosus flavus]|uniref:Extracellular solute-binding protein n=2 Tax=Halospeciosus flavus TaxID=3032283 RepID=A0ABD5Z086_9EURY|nr:extracellular solute-binding protein [Halospeciosus flavus]
MGDDNGHTSNDGPTTKRRGFLAATGAAGVASIAGCSSGGGGGETTTPPKDVEPASEINFISESTPPSVAIKGIVDEFQKQTGITVNMTLVPFNNYSEKIASDLTSKSGNYQAFYVDPYVVGAKYYPYIQSLDPFINSDDWADVPKGVNDFIDSHLDACGRYGDGRLRAFPYDCPTMMWVYRDDIINKYKEQAEKDLGFPFEPGPERTWQEYFEMAKWMNENVDEVPYGTGHQAKQHDSLQCDFHNVFWAHGAEDFTGYNGKPGDEVPKSDKITPTFAETGVGAAEFYKNLIDIAHPGSTTWTWSGVGQAFAQGKIAMCPEWHEFNAMFTNPDQSQVADKVSWSLLPQGDKRSANIYGGSGIGINKFASDAEKKAAWKFITWATSPEIQLRILKKTGGTPTRNSVYNMEEVKQAAQASSEESQYPNVVPPVREAWKDSNVGLRPHIPQWPELDKILYTEVSKMINDKKSPKAAMQSIDSSWKQTLQ